MSIPELSAQSNGLMIQMPIADAQTTRTDPGPSRQPPTAHLLRLVESAEPQHDLVPVGLALHHFTEIVRGFVPISIVELHRATTILTKQTNVLIDHDAPLEAVRHLVTDEHRTATVDGRTIEELCGEDWPAVHAQARERANAAAQGARSFGETAILRLAATRAAQTRVPWWGTNLWSRRVDQWLGDARSNHRLRAALMRTPELLSSEILLDLLSPLRSRRTMPL